MLIITLVVVACFVVLGLQSDQLASQSNSEMSRDPSFELRVVKPEGGTQVECIRQMPTLMVSIRGIS